jgi:two-component system, OmpR family, response regulator
MRGRRPCGAEVGVEKRPLALVIDDDVDYRMAVKAILEFSGYTVETAASGREGLHRLREHRPDVIILDVMMESPGEGYAVTQAIKFQQEYEAYADVPIVMVSSIAESPDDRFGRALEADLVRPNVYLTKPLNIPLFLDAVGRATRLRKTTV